MYRYEGDNGSLEQLKFEEGKLHNKISKNFYIFLGGSFITRVGEWMDLVALNWAVMQYTSSPLYLGIINVCRLAPIFILSLPAGVLADRFDRSKLLISIQIGWMGFTFLLASFIANKVSILLIAIVVTLRACLVAIDTSVRNALLPNLVSKTAMSRAISLHTMSINIARMIGPAVAGWLLNSIDISSIFLLNAWGTLAVLLSLIIIHPNMPAMKVKTFVTQEQEQTGLKEAVLYIKEHPHVQSLLILAIAPMVFGFPYTTLMPLFVKELMQHGPQRFGFLLTVSSIGAILGLMILSRREMEKCGKWLVSSIIGFGVSLLLFIILIRSFLLAILAMVITGFTSQLYRTLSRITLQKHVPDHLRGRILSIAMMDRGFIPLGAFVLSAFAVQFGAFWTGMMMGAGCIISTLIVLCKRPFIWKM